MAPTAPKQAKTRLWTPAFVLVLLIALLSFIICQGLNNGTPIYLSYSGGTNLYAGLLILEFSLAAAAARIFIGRRIDRGSRRSVMLAGALVTLAGSFGAVLWPDPALQVLYRALQGLGFGLCTTGASTAAADIVPLDRLGEGLGYYGLGQSLGMVIGPSLGVVLVSFSYHETLFAGMSVLSLVLIAAVLGCTYEKHPGRLDPTCAYRLGRSGRRAADGAAGETAAGPERAGEGAGVSGSPAEVPAAAGSAGAAGAPAGPRRGLGALFEIAALPGALPMLICCFGYSIITNFVSKYGVEQGLPNPGFFFICAAVTMTLVRLAGGRLLDEVPPRLLVGLPLACGIGSFALLAVTHSPAAFYGAGALFGISMGLCFPLCNTVAVRCSPLDRRGAATALYLLANDLGVGIGAVIAGQVIDAVGYTAGFWGGALMLFFAFIAALAVFPRGRASRKG